MGRIFDSNRQTGIHALLHEVLPFRKVGLRGSAHGQAPACHSCASSIESGGFTPDLVGNQAVHGQAALVDLLMGSHGTDPCRFDASVRDNRDAGRSSTVLDKLESMRNED